MRIAMIGHKRIPSREGGVEIVVEELSVRMAQRGHEVTCFNRSGQHVSGREFTAARARSFQGVRLRYVPTIDVKGLAALTASFFAAACAAFGRYDVVHFHSEGPCIALWLPKLAGKRCVVTIHGLDHQRAKWGKLARACILMGEKCAAKLADEIIVLSEPARRYFLDTYHCQTQLIPNGLSMMERCEPELIQEKFGLEKDGYILFLGRITPEKGLDYLIDAYRKTGAGNAGKKLVIAGGSSDSDAYFAGLREKAADLTDVVFTGFVQGQALRELYSNAYFYVLPSDLEGMPLSLLEALSYGNCCLVSDIPENTGVLGGCGYVFSRGDAADLAKKLELLVREPERVAASREAAAARIREMDGWEEVAQRTLMTYEDKK